jgi:hypothetical protein
VNRRTLAIALTLIATGAAAAPAALETRPMTTPETLTSVEYAGIRFPARLTRPAGTPVGAVLIVPGSLNSDVDGNYVTWNVRSNVYADLARQLAPSAGSCCATPRPGPAPGRR